MLLLVSWSIDAIDGLTVDRRARSNILPEVKANALHLPSETSLESAAFLSVPSTRRLMLEKVTCAVLMIGGASSLLSSPSSADGGETAAAAASPPTTTTTASLRYKREQDLKPPQQRLSYEITIPPSMKESAKPVKTHLDEVNFLSESVKGYQYGVTVDPVRITSLKEVGALKC